MLASVASVMAGFYAAAFVASPNAPSWLLTTPVVLGVSWAYLLLAIRCDVTFVRTLVVLGLGALMGAVVSIAPLILFHQITGLWFCCDTVTPAVGMHPIVSGVVTNVLPHWAATLFVAGSLVWLRSRWAQLGGGLLAGTAAGLAQSVVTDGGFPSGAATGSLIGHGAAYLVLVPLLAWLGDQVHPLVDRAKRRIWPAIACVWVIPPAMLLVGGVVFQAHWLGADVVTGLMPVLLLLDVVREVHYGYPVPVLLRHVGVCLIGLALAIGLCPLRRWTWLPWTVWWLHDMAYLGVVIWALTSQLGNVRALSGELPGTALPLNAWPFFAILMGLAYVQAIRAWCLTRRGVRPMW
jgi:hypothetical protein